LAVRGKNIFVGSNFCIDLQLTYDKIRIYQLSIKQFLTNWP